MRAHTIAVAIVTPADGPSLGIAPAGTWMCRVCFSNTSRSMPSSAAFDRIQDSAARADSRMTSPSWPVRMNSSLPSIRVTSTATTSPPTSVTTRPVADPVWSSASSSPYSKRGGPRYSSSFLTSTTVLRLRPSATCLATLRMMLASSRSRLRTPASLVYACTSSVSTSSVISTRLAVRPWFSICLGTRNRRAISTFSCWV